MMRDQDETLCFIAVCCFVVGCDVLLYFVMFLFSFYGLLSCFLIFDFSD